MVSESFPMPVTSGRPLEDYLWGNLVATKILVPPALVKPFPCQQNIESPQQESYLGHQVTSRSVELRVPT